LIGSTLDKLRFREVPASLLVDVIGDMALGDLPYRLGPGEGGALEAHRPLLDRYGDPGQN
jgi:hypothetical protein